MRYLVMLSMRPDVGPPPEELVTAMDAALGEASFDSAKIPFRPEAVVRVTEEKQVGVVLEQVLAAAGVERPEVGPLAGVRGRKGRDGTHTEALSLVLAEMQSVARAHPRGQW